jgi:hypothetical protein
MGGRWALLALLIFLGLTCGCGAIFPEGDHGGVTRLWIEPANPTAGSFVSVRFDVDWGPYVWDCLASTRPSVNFRVSAGELHAAKFYDDEEITGQDITTRSRAITWTLPDTPGQATIWASWDGHGKKLVVTLQ